MFSKGVCLQMKIVRYERGDVFGMEARVASEVRWERKVECE